MSYPRQKLKIVADMEGEDTETREVEKILSLKTVKDKLVYEVLWKNSKLKDWLPIENFNKLEVINKYHQNIEKVVEVKKSSERLRIKNLKQKIPLPLEIPIKKKRGRPAKFVKSNFLLVLVGLFCWLGMVLANEESSIHGKFKFCDQGEGNMLNTEKTCATVPESFEGNKFLDKQFNETKKFYLLDKLAHLVSGQATECKKERIIIKTYKDFFRRESFETKTVVVKVSKVECEYMKVTKMCGDQVMTCENNICSSENYPLETYTWL